MGKIFKITSIAAAVLAINTALAITNGVDAIKSEYKDYMVQFSSSIGGCGGLLINGTHVVTSRHCVDADYTNTYAIPDSIGDITLTQGFEYDAPRFANQRFAAAESDLDVNFADNQLYCPLMEQRGRDFSYNGGVGENYDPSTAVRVYGEGDIWGCTQRGTYFADIVVIALNDRAIMLNQSSALALVETVAFKAGSIPALHVPLEPIEFKGWGVQVDGQRPGVLQSLPLQFFAESNPNLVNIQDTGSITFGVEPFLEMTSTGGGMVSGGDSGTPLVFGHESLGVASRVLSKSAAFANFDGLMPFLSQKINTISTVTHLKDAGASAKWEFPIQNLTQEKTELTLFVDGDETVFVMDDSDCAGEFEVGEYCVVKVSADAVDSDSVSSSLLVTFGAGLQRVIPMELNAATPEAHPDWIDPDAPVIEPVEPTPVEPTPEVSGGGGSFGVWGLLLLTIASVRRIKF